MKKAKKNEPLEFYLSKAYPFVVYPAEEGGYVAEIEELPGCMTQGETLGEVARRIEDARRGWIEVAYEDGMEIPLPQTEEQYSGKFVVRLPKYLHRRLAEQAAREGISLNQYVASLLSSSAATEEVSSMAQHILEELRKQVEKPPKIHYHFVETVSPAEPKVPYQQIKAVLAKGLELEAA